MRSVPRFKNQTVMAIKAPPEAKLQVPHPSEGMQIYMQCDHDTIEVFLCPEDESNSPSKEMMINNTPVRKAALKCEPDTEDDDEEDEDEADDEDETTESEASPVKRPEGVPPPPSPPKLDLDEESRSSELGQIRNILISASEDFGPMGSRLLLQTSDQEPSGNQSPFNRPTTLIMEKNDKKTDKRDGELWSRTCRC